MKGRAKGFDVQFVPWGGFYSSAIGKSLSPLFPVGRGAVVTNEWCITSVVFSKYFTLSLCGGLNL